MSYLVHAANFLNQPVAVTIDAIGPGPEHRQVVLKAFREVEIALEWGTVPDEERTVVAEIALSGGTFVEDAPDG